MKDSRVYVLDASVYAPLIVVKGSELLELIKNNSIAVLDLTVYETCNVFWKEHVKLHRITREEALKTCRVAKKLALRAQLYSIGDLDAERVMEIAVNSNITFYDASYVALAERLGAVVASEDRDILRAAPDYGLETARLTDLLRLFPHTRG